MENQYNLFGNKKFEYKILIVPSASFRYIAKQMQNTLLENDSSIKLEALQIEVGSLILFELDEENFILKLRASILNIQRFNLEQTSIARTSKKQIISLELSSDRYRQELLPTIQAVIGKKKLNKMPLLTLASSNSVINTGNDDGFLRTNHTFEVKELLITKSNKTTDIQEVERMKLA